ncbi:MAG: hypothetical protein OJF51_000812 [Nitrospira sp.]|nr:MAG: hypothetical protein OJF51_000812 [Nitrospira sp.]
MWITSTHIGIHPCILQHAGLNHHKVCLMNRLPLKSTQYQKNSALSVQSLGRHSPCSTQNEKRSRWAEIHEGRDDFPLQSFQRAATLLLTPGGTDLDRLRSVDRRGSVFNERKVPTNAPW